METGFGKHKKVAENVVHLKNTKRVETNIQIQWAEENQRNPKRAEKNQKPEDTKPLTYS